MGSCCICTRAAAATEYPRRPAGGGKRQNTVTLSLSCLSILEIGGHFNKGEKSRERERERERGRERGGEGQIVDTGVFA